MVSGSKLFGLMGFRWMQGVSMVILSMLLLIMVPQHLSGTAKRKKKMEEVA
jgi:hypothetical protein